MAKSNPRKKDNYTDQTRNETNDGFNAEVSLDLICYIFHNLDNTVGLAFGECPFDFIIYVMSAG